MHAASRHGTPSLTSLPKDGRLSCFGRFGAGTSKDHPSGVQSRFFLLFQEIFYNVTALLVNERENNFNKRRMRRLSELTL